MLKGGNVDNTFYTGSEDELLVNLSLAETVGN